MTTQPKTFTTMTALIIAIIIVVSSIGFAAANADSTGFVTGTTWVDANNNDMREPNEVIAAGTPVTLLPVGDDAVAAGGMTVFSDANGNFDFGTVAFGTYQVQAAEGGMVEVTLSEANSTASVEVPVYSNDSGPALQGSLIRQIFLPLVSR